MEEPREISFTEEELANGVTQSNGVTRPDSSVETSVEFNALERVINELSLDDIRRTLVKFNAFKGFIEELAGSARHKSNCLDLFAASYARMPGSAYPVWDRFVSSVTEWLKANGERLENLVQLPELRVTPSIFIDWSSLRDVHGLSAHIQKLQAIKLLYLESNDALLSVYDPYGAAHFQAAFVKYEGLFVDKTFDDILDEIVSKPELQNSLKSLAKTLTGVIEMLRSSGLLDMSKLIGGEIPVMPLVMNLMKTFSPNMGM